MDILKQFLVSLLLIISILRPIVLFKLSIVHYRPTALVNTLVIYEVSVKVGRKMFILLGGTDVSVSYSN